MIGPDDFRFFLDSGAYSAWTRGTEIDLDEYCAFIRSNIERIEAYACLDVIPGMPGVVATEEERVSAAEQTWDNFLYMRREGLDPMPVFHYGEPWRFLDRMINHGCDYIGIGGLVSVPSTQRRFWLDMLFSRICDSEGLPTVKTHGFGMTAIDLIFRYPWHSVDSSAWLQVTMKGAVYLPAMRDGEFVFDRAPAVVTVSNSNPKVEASGKHASALPPNFRAVLDRWLKFCGKNYESCHASYFHRAAVNATFFREVAAAKAVHPFKLTTPRQQSFL